MRHSTRMTTAVILFAAVAGLVTRDARGETERAGFVRVAPGEVVWKSLPGYNGAQFAVLHGDPSKPGIYVIRAKFSPGTMTRPHWHPEDRYVTVVSGTWYTGEGDAFDPDKTVALKPGSFMLHPAKAHHYDGAKDEEVIVQIIGIGPSNTTLIDPKQGHTGSSIKKP